MKGQRRGEDGRARARDERGRMAAGSRGWGDGVGHVTSLDGAVASASNSLKTEIAQS